MVPHRRVLGGGVTCKMARQGRGECAVRGASRHAHPVCEKGGDGRAARAAVCARAPRYPVPPCRGALRRGCRRRLKEGWGGAGEDGGRGVCYRQHPRSQSSGRANSSAPPSLPQRQPTVAPSISCACWWATRTRACGWASTWAPSMETTSPHRTPARAAASGTRACRGAGQPELEP